MGTIEEKRRLILEHETWFAKTLAQRVIKGPKLSIWMILIPIIFIFYFFQLQKVADGRKEFVENYLKSRVRALDAAVTELRTGQRPDTLEMARLSDVPEDIRPMQAEFSDVLLKHYLGLLRADGEDFTSLVRAAYRDKANLLLVYNRLNQAEEKVDAALKPRLEQEKALEDVSNTINAIEAESEALRREIAEDLFG